MESHTSDLEIKENFSFRGTQTEREIKLKRKLIKKCKEIWSLETNLTKEIEKNVEQETELKRLRELNHQQKLQLELNEELISKLKNGERELIADISDFKKRLDIQLNINSDLQSQLKSANENLQKAEDNLEKVQRELDDQRLNMESMQEINLDLSSELELSEKAVLNSIDAKALKNTITALENQLWEYKLCEENNEQVAASNKRKIRHLEEKNLTLEKKNLMLEEENLRLEEELYAFETFEDEDAKYQLQREIELRNEFSSILLNFIYGGDDGAKSNEQRMYAEEDLCGDNINAKESYTDTGVGGNIAGTIAKSNAQEGSLNSKQNLESPPSSVDHHDDENAIAVQAFQTDINGNEDNTRKCCDGESSKNAGASPVSAPSRKRKSSTEDYNVDDRDKVSKKLFGRDMKREELFIVV